MTELGEEDGPRTRTAIIAFISWFVDQNGYPPSVREIGDGVGLKSSSSVHLHLVTLQREGRIRRDASKPRTIVLVPEGSEHG